LKILHLLDSPDRGGAEVIALDLCRNGKKNGLDITLVVTSKGSLFEEFRSSGADFIFIERKMPIDFRLIYKLQKIVKKKGIKVIHGHQAVDGLHAYLTKVFTNVKTILSFHGYTHSIKNDITLKFLIPRMDANIAVSNSFLKRLKGEIKFDTSKNFHVIYNGIDTKKFFKADRNFRKELNLSDSDILLGMVGNFNDNIRDQITVCRALPSIFNKYPKAHFVFVGRRVDESPQYYDECFTYCQENRILDKTHFLGLRTNINDILNSLDLFIYSSNHDTFGIAVIEAMIVGVPVVVNDLPPLLEVSNNGEFAEIYQTKNVFDLVRKVDKLLVNRDYMKKLGNTGKEWALSRFRIENHIQNLKTLYAKIGAEDK